jgi:vanillate monooxygenase
MTFLRNQWYVAGTAAELGDKPLGRMICNEPIVFFRRSDGSVAALEDRCPHRKYALSLGTVLGDELQCGYHGIQLDGSGRCTKIPSQTAIPRGFGVRAYPVIEKYALLYIWMGDPAQADPVMAYDWHWNTDAGWTAVHGYHHVAGHYQLVVDNLLDLTHLAIVHKTTLAGPGLMENPLQVMPEGDVVRSLRVMKNVDASPVLTVYKKPTGKIDRIQEAEFRAPGYVCINVIANPAGSNDKTPVHVVLNSLTPETDRSTHYFWSVARPGALDDKTVDELYDRLIRIAFDEDKAIIEIQQRMIDGDGSGTPLVSLEGDKAGAAARRIVARKLAEETRTTAAA